MRRHLMLVLVLTGLVAPALGQQLQLPNQAESVKFAVFGDTGTGTSSQYAVGNQAASARAVFPFEFALLAGDNIYGSEAPRDFKKKFEEPYKAMLDAGVKFYAALGNHDELSQRLYKPFNMNGERYYTFKPADGVRFFALDSNYIDEKQLAWIEKELAASGSDWKICYFHHPLYSSGGRHGSADLQRERLEPIFLKYGVTVVFSGHEHFYEIIKPQKGIAYFTLGNSAKLRKGDIQKTNLTARGWDQGYGFMLVEILGDDLHFQVISAKSQTIDSGSVHRLAEQSMELERVEQSSITMYNEHHLFEPNPIKRYSVGTKNKDLKRGADHALTIYVQADQPTDFTQLAARSERRLLTLHPGVLARASDHKGAMAATGGAASDVIAVRYTSFIPSFDVNRGDSAPLTCGEPQQSGRMPTRTANGVDVRRRTLHC
jgi:3',5'-cyclic AMP phosphodiesterase CpdA